MMNRFIAAGFVMLACGVLMPAVKADEGNRKTAGIFSAPIMAFRPTGEAVQLADVVTALPVVAAAAPAPVAPVEVLPSTASNLPPIGLPGLMAIGGAFAARAAASRLHATPCRSSEGAARGDWNPA